MFGLTIPDEYKEKYKSENVKNLLSKLVFITAICLIGGIVAISFNFIRFREYMLNQSYTYVYITVAATSAVFFLIFLIINKNYKKMRKAAVPMQIIFFLVVAGIATWISAYQSEISITQPLVFLFVLILSSVLLGYTMYLNIIVITVQEVIYVAGCIFLLGRAGFDAEIRDNIMNSGFAFALSIYILFLVNSTKLQNFSLGESVKEKLSQLELFVNMDPLTGIMNRKAFDIHIISELERCRKESIAFTLMFLDIDDFRVYNECYGHLQGDNCLIQVSKRISSSLSRNADKLFRFNGGTFALVLPGANTSGCEVVVKRIMGEIKNLDIPHEDSPYGRITVSVGIFTEKLSLSSTLTVPKILELADKSLNKAKLSGKNTFFVHENKNDKS